jgi:IS1 family transposase
LTQNDRYLLIGSDCLLLLACLNLWDICFGMGIRAIERLTGLNRHTVLNILESAGDKCARFLNEHVRNVQAGHIQADELNAIVGCKPVHNWLDDDARGSFYTFLSVDRGSKLIINWRVGKRTRQDAEAFLRDLKSRVSGRFQLSTDGWHTYCGHSGAVRHVFGESIDYAVEIKRYAAHNPDTFSRFESPRLISIQKKVRIGAPDLNLTTTSHCERTNLTVRLFNRRFARLTLGYSKKLANLRHSVAIFVTHFNFCRRHSAHGTTPAQAANLTDHEWTIAEILSATI